MFKQSELLGVKQIVAWAVARIWHLPSLGCLRAVGAFIAPGALEIRPFSSSLVGAAHSYFVNPNISAPAATRITTDRPYIPAKNPLDASPFGLFNDHTEDAIQHLIATFTPKMSRQLWRAIGDFTRSAVTDFAPLHQREAEFVMSAVARLVAWSRETGGMKLQRQTIFGGNNIEAYIKRGLENYSPYSAAHTRRYLMRFAHELNVVDMDLVKSRPARKPATQQPYTDAEMGRFRAMGTYRSTELRKYRWTVYLSLAAGCALSAQEISQLRRSDVTDSPSGVTVGVSDREVTCSAEFEDDLRLCLHYADDDYFFPSQRTNPRDGNHAILTYILRMAGTEQAPNPGRLRATWIVGQLNRNTPVKTIMAALGVTTLRPLEGYIRYVAEADADTARAQLRGAVNA